jgi:chromosomal replication initiation ATPase DnaA
MKFEDKINLIIQEVADYHDLSVEDVKSKSRKLKTVRARHQSIYIINKIFNPILLEIGSYFHLSDHTSVMNAIQNVRENILPNALPEAQKIQQIIEHKINTLESHCIGFTYGNNQTCYGFFKMTMV